MPQLALIADDLTGALDAAAPFAMAGLRCVVAISPAHLLRALAAGADVVAVSTNSREGGEAAAVAQVLAVAQALAAVPQLFKKVDSRLKGHVAAEVRALAGLRGLDAVLLCPAIPAMGRVMAGGRISGFGIEAPIDAAQVMPGAVLPDAGSDADLDALLPAAPGVLLAGARGLAAALARRMGQGAVTLPGLPGPVGLAIGSRDPITLAQVQHLCGALAVELAPAPNGVFAGPALRGPLRALQLVPGAAPVTSASATATFAAAFATGIAPGCASLILTGGETAAAVLDHLGIGVLHLLGEALPGLPVSEPLDFPEPLRILTKSGGFGAPDTLTRLLHPEPARLTA